MVDLARILLGGALLALGRKLFWLFVATIGFFAAIELSSRLLRAQPVWISILLALLVGVIGALLAIFLQGVAIWVAGFLAGGYLAISLLAMFGLDTGALTWIGFFIGGILGGVLAGLMFDWALIILSSLSGATLIVQALPFDRVLAVLAFVGLFVIGIAIQASILRSEKK